ncbi:MAG TPA: ankyrin repeat domain-containing protein [Rhodothermales bacterium]|nr:ankyrin repeat domain-containing protein [Rhodothermales bacterium]
MMKPSFFEAIRAGDADTVQDLLDQHPDLLATRSENGETPMLVAAYRGAHDIIALLRGRGAVLNIFEAAAVGDTERVQVLIADNPALLQTYSPDGWTPLHLACFFGHAETARVLLDAGSEVRCWSRNATKNTPLHAAIAGIRDHALIERLIEQGADVNAAGGAGVTPLHLAASRGDMELVDLLLTHGATGSSMDDGQSPADIAEKRGHPGVAAHLWQV